jgi:hypothetical protein
MALGGLARLFCRALPLFGKLSGLLRRALLLRRPARFFRRANAPLGFFALAPKLLGSLARLDSSCAGGRRRAAAPCLHEDL